MEHPLASGGERDWTAPGHDVLHIDQPRAARVVETLDCPARREILTHLWDRPLTASEAARRIDCSTQNAHYHLRKLANNGLVDVVDTTLSDRGYRMDLYAPAEVPVVVVAPPGSGRAPDPETQEGTTGGSERASGSTSAPSHPLDPS
jgi:DNA-binding transcriptional ArsR family regulator